MERPAEPVRAESAPPDFILDDIDFPQPAVADDPFRPEDGAAGDDNASRRHGRRRRSRPAASAVAGSRPAFLRATDPILRWGPLALLAFAPLAWGSVEAWSEMVVVAGSCSVGAIWILRLALFPECVAAERAAGGHVGSWSAGLLIPLAAVLGVGVVQLAPLGGLVAVVSPVAAELQRQAGIGAGSQSFSLARQETLRALAQYVGYALLFLAVFDGLPGRAEVRRLAAAIVVLGFAHALGGILWHYQSSGRPYWSTAAGGSSFGPYINRNHFACLMGMAVPFGIGYLLSFGHRRPDAVRAPGTQGVQGDAGDLDVGVGVEVGVKIAPPPRRSERRSQLVIFGFLVAVMTGALGLSLSRGGIVSTLVALSAFAVVVAARRSTRGHVWGVAGAIAAALAFTVWLVAQPLIDRMSKITDSKDVAARTGIWEDTVRMAGDFPFFGTGFGTYAEVYPVYQTAHADGRVLFAHSDWVQLLAEGGLAGTLAVLAVVGWYAAAAAKRLGRRRDREAIFLGLGALGGLLAFLLHGFTEFNAHIPANALWFTVLAALALKTLSTRMVDGP